MTWSTNITEAQTGDYVWLAMKCGRVIRSWWIPQKGPRGYWAAMDMDEKPIAWQPFIKPIHPFELAKQEERAL